MREQTNQIEPSTSMRLAWPSPQDYSEAVQTPTASFIDQELRQGQVETTSLGLPRSASGNFATVFCFQCPQRKVAVRCFLHHIPDQQERYQAISQYVLHDNLPCTVPFEYVQQGIRIHGDWFPILKMEWVDGVTLKQFIETNLNNGMALNLLASYFKEMTLSLARCGIAHGDLQHDNIMISSDELRLVDYDGMYVPALSGLSAGELGHPNYQHPLRCETDFGPYLDNFSAWVIYTSLKALSRDPSLWPELNANGECLLFRRTDFEHPERSQARSTLINHSDSLVRDCARQLFELGQLPLRSVPYLDPAIEQDEPVMIVEPVLEKASSVSVSIQSENSNLSSPSESVTGADEKQLPTPVSLFGRLTDPNYPQYTLIKIDRDAMAENTKVVSEIQRQLCPGETLRWSNMLSPRPSPFAIIAALLFMLLACFTIMLSWQYQMVLVTSLFLLALFWVNKQSPLLFQALPKAMALTDRRIVVLTASGLSGVNCANVPLDNVVGIKIQTAMTDNQTALLSIGLTAGRLPAISAVAPRETLKQLILQLPPSIVVEGQHLL